MTEPTDEGPRGRPYLLLAGLGLLVGAGVAWWWSRRDCGCDHSEDAQEPTEPARDFVAALKPITRTFHRGHARTEPSGPPAVDPLSWDAHAENAWGVAFGGERKLDDYRAPDDASELTDDAELGGEG